ncbi:DHH family phosphoesterase [Halobellus limi]|jgi:nanoRNase/pAp phosphatase (c-di-AMP/oligoRNAs hydrolase)|uniref:Bifunctional oligoribonuclease/PAP phosphatase NrnA n=1 Tax=Halobellus limi TaxID=699433 RepID=A0A1H6ASQ8_9EURY|nr:bifunctional oligoribonuclease/PAP phosphatase NrnA [Halobellus limi]QCC47709.1 bifunctional oligoribonuclease/PAP phosphatase NrnA [Halobellus limi]SEG51105.1 nanoRNase/pAp phosphatase, hydrolyzes c-di-AMP and oligoRNAs [Halobellus limi]
MQRRLVLGCGSDAREAVERLAEWPGELTVVAESGCEGLQTGVSGVTVERGAPEDPGAYPPDAELVFVASDDAETNADAAARARAQYPDAQVIVYLGVGAAEETRATVERVADRVVDAERVLGDRIRDLTLGLGANRLQRLFAALRRIDGRLAVVMHDNPDPDAIASALALSRIAAAVGVSADSCYFGDISHQENRALVNLLDLDLIELDDEADLDAYDGVALVDHSRPGVNDGLPEDTQIDIVVDHHPPRAPVEAHFVDLRRDIGATSTLLAEYLRRAGIDPEESLATALLFGIRIDTNDFAREVSTTDFEAAAWLLTHADLSALDRVESPSMTSAVLETLARAIRDRDVRGDALASNVGPISDRDALAQAADRLLNMEGIRIAVVYGFKDGTVYVSGRARGTDVDLGESLRDALGAIGSAGGHADMAGAQVPLGILGDTGEESTEELSAIVTEVIAGRIFETLEDATTLLDVGPEGAEWVFESPFDSFEE